MKVLLYFAIAGMFWIPQGAEAFDDLRPKFKLDLLYHYARTERATTNTNVNFLSRAGGMVQFEYSDPVGLFWRYYLGGDVTYGLYQAPGSVGINPSDYIPWQVYGGLALQVGSLKNLELFIGLGGSSEYYSRLVAVDSFQLGKHFVRSGSLGI